MSISKTISGTINVNLSIDLPVPGAVFPRNVQVNYEWFPTDTPTVKNQGRRVRGSVEVTVSSGTTMGQMLTAARNAIAAQEAAADGGGHTVVEES